jgi:putative methionine-R-sulfoxide reductase with GAF domain
MHPQETRPVDANAAYSIFGRERRRSSRHRVQTPAYASLSGSSQAAALELCEILDISDSGMCIQGSSPLDVNRLLPLVLDLSKTSAVIHTIGFVVWSDASGKTGIRFPQLPKVSQGELDEWLMANASINECAALPVSPLEPAEPFFVQPELVSGPFPAGGQASLVAAWLDLEEEVDFFGDDLGSALHLVAQRAVALTWATGAAIALIDRLKPSELVCRAYAGVGTPELGDRLQAGSGFSGACVRSATTLKCDDTETDPRVDPESCRSLGIRSLVACPVKRRTGETMGILEVFSPEIAAFWEKDCANLARLAWIIAKAVERYEHSLAGIVAVNQSAENQSQAANNPGEEPGEEKDAPDSKIAADTLRPQQRFSYGLFGRRGVRIVVAAMAAIAFIAWLIGPAVTSWVKDSPAKPESPSTRQSSAGQPSLNSFAGVSAEDLRRLALNGDPAAQYALGLRYASGDGVRRNYHEAMEWFLKSADQGDARAAAKLAGFFWSGRGSPRDYGRAYFWGLLAQAAGDEQGRLIVISCAPHLSPAQSAGEQQEADKWLHSHHILPSSGPAR